jgi:broad specificity phosphatase PhoE
VSTNNCIFSAIPKRARHCDSTFLRRWRMPRQDGKTVVLWLRHGPHTNQVVPPDALAVIKAEGAALKAVGVVPDVVLSSPQPRAVWTALAFMAGNGCTAAVKTDPALGDSTSDAIIGPMVPEIKAGATAAGVKVEEWLLTSPNPSLRRRILDRANDAVYCIKIAVERAPVGSVILVCGHGGSFEPTLLTLNGHSFEFAKAEIPIVVPFYWGQSAMAATFIHSAGKVGGTHYLGVIHAETNLSVLS